MKTPVIQLWPDESGLGWKVYRSVVYMEMEPKSVGFESLIGVINPPKLKPSEWSSELQENLTKEEQEAIYERIKDKDNVLEDIVISFNPE